MMISAAFHYKGWSKVTMVGRLCFMARLQTNSNVDTMHDFSPEYILIIAKNLTDDWCCLFEADGHFPQNIDPLVTVKTSRHALEDYLMTSMPCKHVLQDRNFCLVFSFQF